MVMLSRIVIVLASESSETFDMVPDIWIKRWRLIIISYCNSWNKVLKGIPHKITQVGPDEFSVFRHVIKCKVRIVKKVTKAFIVTFRKVEF